MSVSRLYTDPEIEPFDNLRNYPMVRSVAQLKTYLPGTVIFNRSIVTSGERTFFRCRAEGFNSNSERQWWPCDENGKVLKAAGGDELYIGKFPPENLYLPVWVVYPGKPKPIMGAAQVVTINNGEYDGGLP